VKSSAAYANLRDFGKDVMTTEDAAVRLRMSVSGASRVLSRLAADGLVVRLRHGLWSLRAEIDPFELTEALTAPFPAYVSLQSALYRHGLISQIPQVVYVVSLARTQRVTTTIATYSIHHLPPALFGGYETRVHVNLATPEKALVDTLYLANARSGLFARLPEVELPDDFRVEEARRWIVRIPAQNKRAMVETRFEPLLAAATPHSRRPAKAKPNARRAKPRKSRSADRRRSGPRD
jgi:predicted transcriptional regulator of viral defense system